MAHESPTDQSVEWDEDGAKNFLIRIGAGSIAAAPTAKTLLAAGYNTLALLLAATEDDLLEAGVNKPVMRLILSSRQQQQNGKLRCCFVFFHFPNLIVKAPPASEQDGVQIDSEPEPKKLKSKETLDMSTLLPPLELQPPPKPSKPEFTCNDGWMESVEIEIEAQLERSDDPSGSERLPPMAVVRCSRGGKTRALYEIANRMHEHVFCPRVGGHVAVIYVSFNDFSSLEPSEQQNPLEALCQRIVFSACRERNSDKSKATAYEAFRSKNYATTADQIVEWLGDTPAILLVDELNNLTELTVKDSRQASEFGLFIKKNFLAKEGRYFVFSSHVLSTVAAFGEFIDTSQGSARHVTLQELPLVDNLSTARKRLYSNLDGAREAIYYGLLPGMLYEQSRGKPIAGKREKAVRSYNEEPFGTKDRKFKEILRSLFSGNIDDVPAKLHILLDGCGEAGSLKIRWVPFHLEYVLEHVTLSDESKLPKLSSDMAQLCKGLKEADEASGKGWEALFVLFLVARCINHCPDGYFVPEHWFDGPSKFDFNPYFNAKKPFNRCKTWDQLKEGITASETPTISVFYPSHASFNVYDAIAVYSANNIFVEVYGYQLNEGKANPNQLSLLPSDFTKSVTVKGNPPTESEDRNGWTFPCGDVIDKFFGESGKHWTPQHWKLLTDTCDKEGSV